MEQNTQIPIPIQEKKLPVIGFKEVQKPFSLTIKKEVQDKIDLICSKINKDEWSGVLFYTTEGSFTENNLNVLAQDIYVMDIGSAAYTEYTESPDIITYMAENDLLDCGMGLIHSHNNMETFFSGTDTNTLREEAMCHNHFVSLIVNNRRTYTAAVTTVLKTKSKSKVTELYEYITFDGSVISDTEETEIDEEKSEIIWSKLKVIIDVPAYNNTEIIARLDEIAKKKREAYRAPIYQSNKYNGTAGWQGNNPNNSFTKGMQEMDFNRDFKIPVVREVPTAKTFPIKEFSDKRIKDSVITVPTKEETATDEEDNSLLYDTVLQDKLTDLLAKKIVMGSMLVPENNKINLNNFIPRMEEAYTAILPTKEAFDFFISGFIETILFNIDDVNLYSFDEDKTAAIAAFSLISYLQEFPMNEYLNAIITELSNYVI